MFVLPRGKMCTPSTPSLYGTPNGSYFEVSVCTTPVWTLKGRGRSEVVLSRVIVFRQVNFT